MKGVARILFIQWKKGRVEGAQIVSYIVLEEAFLGHLFTRDLRKEKVGEFHTHKHESMSLHEYTLMFT